MSESAQQLHPDALCVVACPVCQGHVAATGELCGRDVCCPLCASLFHVPFPGPEGPATVAPEPEPAGMAEDWESVITQLAPPRTEEREPSPPPQEAVLESLDGPLAELAAHPLPEPPVAPSPADSPALSPAAATPATSGTAAEAAPAADPPAEQPAATESPPQEPEPVVPRFDAAVADARAEDLVFTEPVRTVQQGNRIIEIRRLSPEERRSRRFRRNLMMVVVGVSILLAIVIMAGF